MTLRGLKSLRPDLLIQSGADALEAEILAERAAALGRSGAAVERSLAALRACPDGDERPRLVLAAAQAGHGFFIQRQLRGLRSHAEAIERYAIPRAVLAKVGAR